MSLLPVDLISVARVGSLPNSASMWVFLLVFPRLERIIRFCEEALFSGVGEPQFYRAGIDLLGGSVVIVIKLHAFTRAHPAAITGVIEFAGIN